MFIREFFKQDFGQVIALWKDTGVYDEERGDSLEAILESKAQGGVFYVVEDPRCGKIKGSVWMTWDGRRHFLHHLAVGPEVQGQGWGSRLCEACLEQARTTGAPVKLEVHKANRAAIHLYRKLGFKDFSDYLLFMHPGG